RAFSTASPASGGSCRRPASPRPCGRRSPTRSSTSGAERILDGRRQAMMFHVGNLSPETTRENLIEAFRAFGEVASVTLPGERMKGVRAAGAHRGYGFVRMTD